MSFFGSLKRIWCVSGILTFSHYSNFIQLPVMNPYPGPQSVILMDNARVHHSDAVTELVYSRGCQILYLPPYCPQYQPIELAFSTIKSHLKRWGLHMYDAGVGMFFELYHACTMVIKPEMTWGWFRHCGYV
ncbi:hypothetical protein K435DRAFT_664092 [Dendrothele bispora CBS 962.96]|uniref:Tc1-like transposase DDE domain-containing protein n=1 Tax=Dendrothele bispora (strain CBS 962.96) TaxID=1314807 RepID=A0A4V4HFX6_DENBC|nr:hypothetical protein K435DRAFT_664092 [Dendrothele bispora CBS 962.96]